MSELERIQAINTASIQADVLADLRDQVKDAQATIATMTARVAELEGRAQRQPAETETVCHSCDGSGWVERGY